MPHERTWAMWLDGLTNLTAAAVWCNPGAQECLKEAQRPGQSVYDYNHFFTAYVFQMKGPHDFPPGNIFHGRVVNTVRGTQPLQSLVQAEGGRAGSKQ